ncbi:hypothetical protein [Vreelandella neptunia]|uniref:Uncharacterized protein n=1 Tax=Vreelandella neptunia TaxID=115551 RepID=A0ABS9S6V5_9GAMM|nr:hypothetical protein [Halomonas neptunia]MCH4811847.1 hypothetical protein [Halomonas neptunia]
MKEELDITTLISKEQIAGGSGQRNLYCPVCKCINSHVKPPFFMVDEKWHGNGVLAVTPMWSECGSEWEVCIGSHKGDAPIFIRVTKYCK